MSAVADLQPQATEQVLGGPSGQEPATPRGNGKSSGKPTCASLQLEVNAIREDLDHLHNQVTIIATSPSSSSNPTALAAPSANRAIEQANNALRASVDDIRQQVTTLASRLDSMEGGLKDVREFAENVDGESAARLDAVEGRLREDQSLGSRVGAMESRVLALESATPTNTLAVLRDHERSVDVKIEALRVEIGKLDLNIQKNALTNTVSTAAHPATSTNDQSIVYPADKRLRTGFDMQPTTSTIQPFPIQPSTFGGNHTAPRASNLGRGGGRFGKQNSGPNSRIRVGPGYWTGQGSNAMDIARKLVSETVLAQGSFFRPHNLVNAYFEDPGQTVLVIDISGATGAEMLLNSWPARFPPWVAQWGTTRAERVQQGNGMGQGMM